MTRLTRSSYVKIALIVALALLLFAVAGAGSMRGCSQGIYLGGGTEMGNASVDAKSERNLSVSWAAGSVDISVVDDGAGDVIELVETAPTGLTKAQQMRWSVSGGTLKVDYGSWWSCFALGQKRLEVRNPRALRAEPRRRDRRRRVGLTIAWPVSAATRSGSSWRRARSTRTASPPPRSTWTWPAARCAPRGTFSERVSAKTASGQLDVVCQGAAPKQVSVAPAADTGFTAKVSKASGSFSSAFETVQQGGSYVHGDGSTAVHVNLASGDFRVEKS